MHHPNISHFQQTVNAIPNILHVFERHNVHSFMDLSPTTIVDDDGHVITTFESIVQCNQDSWNVRIGTTYHDALVDPYAFVSIAYAYQRSHLSLQVKFRPYTQPVGTLIVGQGTDLEAVQKIILYRSIANQIDPEGSRVTSLSLDDYWTLIDRLAIETNRRNNKASAKRRIPRNHNRQAA